MITCYFCGEVFNDPIRRDRHEEEAHPEQWASRVVPDVTGPDHPGSLAHVRDEIRRYADSGRAVLVHGYTFRRWREAFDADERATLASLCVLVKTPTIRAYLAQHDPKALEQADKAVAAAGRK